LNFLNLILCRNDFDVLQNIRGSQELEKLGL
jgi:hypothetical protein